MHAQLYNCPAAQAQRYNCNRSVNFSDHVKRKKKSIGDKRHWFHLFVVHAQLKGLAVSFSLSAARLVGQENGRGGWGDDNTNCHAHALPGLVHGVHVLQHREDLENVDACSCTFTCSVGDPDDRFWGFVSWISDGEWERNLPLKTGEKQKRYNVTDWMLDPPLPLWSLCVRKPADYNAVQMVGFHIKLINWNLCTVLEPPDTCLSTLAVSLLQAY